MSTLCRVDPILPVQRCRFAGRQQDPVSRFGLGFLGASASQGFTLDLAQGLLARHLQGGHIQDLVFDAATFRRDEQGLVAQAAQELKMKVEVVWTRGRPMLVVGCKVSMEHIIEHLVAEGGRGAAVHCRATRIQLENLPGEEEAPSLAREDTSFPPELREVNDKLREKAEAKERERKKGTGEVKVEERKVVRGDGKCYQAIEYKYGRKDDPKLRERTKVVRDQGGRGVVRGAGGGRGVGEGAGGVRSRGWGAVGGRGCEGGVGGGRGEAVEVKEEEFPKRVEEVLKGRPLGAWAPWVERQHLRRFGCPLPIHWLAAMEERGQVEKDQAGLVTLASQVVKEEHSGEVAKEQVSLTTLTNKEGEVTEAMKDAEDIDDWDDIKERIVERKGDRTSSEGVSEINSSVKQGRGRGKQVQKDNLPQEGRVGTKQEGKVGTKQEEEGVSGSGKGRERTAEEVKLQVCMEGLVDQVKVEDLGNMEEVNQVVVVCDIELKLRRKRERAVALPVSKVLGKELGNDAIIVVEIKKREVVQKKDTLEDNQKAEVQVKELQKEVVDMKVQQEVNKVEKEEGVVVIRPKLKLSRGRGRPIG